MDVVEGLFSPRPDPVAVLNEAIERLQIGIVTNLASRYHGHVPPSEALLLANCVLSHATLLDPLGAEAQVYQKKHTLLVLSEASRLASVAEVSQALSYLYAAITMLLAIRTADPFSELAAKLGARATELSVSIPNTFDICGSGDAVTCIHALRTFADKYLNQALGQ